MPPPIALSKTRLLSFLQCPRKLWLEQYSPELEDEDAVDWTAIETGNVVGETARRTYGANGGHRISNDRGLRAAVADTAALLEAGGSDPLFEATFDHDGLTVQVDIFDRSGPGPRILEVKASTTVKEHYLLDCAIQAWTAEQCGQQPTKVIVAHLNAEFEYQGHDDYSGLFSESDVTDAVTKLLPRVPEIVEQTRSVLDELDEPEHPIGEHCSKPHQCQFFAHCAPQQGRYPVSGLGGGKNLLLDLMQQGYTDLRDVPEDRLADDTQRLISEQTRLGSPRIDPELKAFADALPYPRYFLDFETVSFAVPIWAGTRPYEALPFQWSCDVQSSGRHTEHRDFLNLSGEPPMRECAETVIDALGSAGPVIVYTSYEQRILRDLTRRFPDLAGALGDIESRIVDLYPLTRKHYYHPDMLGSWSIKAVVPTVAPDLDYASLGNVRDGQQAQQAYLEAIDTNTDESRREELRRSLIEYCRCDTLALVRLIEFFSAQVGSNEAKP